MAAMKPHGVPRRRYSTQYTDDGAFIVSDRTRAEDKRWLPTQFLYGQRGYDSRVERYPGYVHGDLWAMYDARQRDQLQAALHKSTRVNHHV